MAFSANPGFDAYQWQRVCSPAFTNTTAGFNTPVSVAIAKNGSNVYVATAHGLVISRNGGTTYTEVVLPAETVNDVFVSGSNVYASTDQGLYVSSNNGSSFPIDDEICALTSAFDCQADMQIDFATAVNGLRFVTSGWDDGDHIHVNVYDGAVLLGTVGKSTNGLVDLTAFSHVTSIYLDDSSTGAGFGYDHFIFAIPEPDTYAMLLAGFGLLSFVARRKRA